MKKWYHSAHIAQLRPLLARPQFTDLPHWDLWHAFWSRDRGGHAAAAAVRDRASVLCEGQARLLLQLAGRPVRASPHPPVLLPVVPAQLRADGGVVSGNDPGLRVSTMLTVYVLAI